MDLNYDGINDWRFYRELIFAKKTQVEMKKWKIYPQFHFSCGKRRKLTRVKSRAAKPVKKFNRLI